VENLPGGVELNVILDGEPLYRRPPSAGPGVATFSVDKQVPAGRRSFQVVVASPLTERKNQKTARGDWKPGEHRTLRIELGRIEGDGLPKLNAKLD
jgi:hypothetical protein